MENPDAGNHSATPGRLRRRITVRNEDAGTAVGWVEDDFHHFGVTVEHDGRAVTAVRVAAERFPWLTCGEVGEPLRALVGRPLVARASDIGLHLEMRQQCTHVFDLAGLVLAQASRRAEARRDYEALVDDRPLCPGASVAQARFGGGAARLLRDGRELLAWQLDDSRIVAPPRHAGQSLQTGFRAWTEAMDIDAAEAAFILRRAVLVAGGRSMNHDDYANADAMGTPALCHTFQPGRRVLALRCRGASRDYADAPAAMLARAAERP